jgi:hypothetical protein
MITTTASNTTGTVDDTLQLSAHPLLPPLHYDKAAAVGALLGITSAELEHRLQLLLDHRSELKHRRRQQGRRARKAARQALAAARSEAAVALRHQVQPQSIISIKLLLRNCDVVRLHSSCLHKCIYYHYCWPMLMLPSIADCVTNKLTVNVHYSASLL